MFAYLAFHSLQHQHHKFPTPTHSQSGVQGSCPTETVTLNVSRVPNARALSRMYVLFLVYPLFSNARALSRLYVLFRGGRGSELLESVGSTLDYINGFARTR